MHGGVCIAESRGWWSLKRFFWPPPLYTVVVMHSKLRYAVQYTLLTLKPHATDARAPDVTESRQQDLVTFYEWHVQQASASHRFPCRSSIFEQYEPSLSSGRRVTSQSLSFRPRFSRFATDQGTRERTSDFTVVRGLALVCLADAQLELKGGEKTPVF